MAVRLASDRRSAAARPPLLVLGFGLGAFLDGIVLHQVLQWHHLVQSRISVTDRAGLESNTFWDGVFHLAVWGIVVTGVAWSWGRRDALGQLSGRAASGLLLVGWGTFNLVDQVVFHMILEAHHIRMVDDYLVYDLGFTAIGIGLIATGWLLHRRTS